MDVNNKLSLGQRIRFRRKELNLSQEQLAEKLYITRQMVTNYERDNVDIKVSVLLEISKALKVSPAYFFSEVWDWKTDRTASDLLKGTNVIAMFEFLPDHFKCLVVEWMVKYVFFVEKCRLAKERENAK